MNFKKFLVTHFHCLLLTDTATATATATANVTVTATATATVNANCKLLLKPANLFLVFQFFRQLKPTGFIFFHLINDSLQFCREFVDLLFI